MAAQSIIEELPRLNEAIRAEIPSFAHDLQMRIGIHSGTVVMGEEGSDLGTARLAIGEALNLASRIESVAPVNGIAVSQVTARRVQGVVDLAPLGLTPLKGIDQPVEVFRRADPARAITVHVHRGARSLRGPRRRGRAAA